MNKFIIISYGKNKGDMIYELMRAEYENKIYYFFSNNFNLNNGGCFSRRFG